MAGCNSSYVAFVCPAETMTPASDSARMIEGVVRSGARVTMVTPPVGVASSFIASSSSVRSLLASCTPRRSSLRNGPSM
jgi:hypothetical protein